MTRHLAALIDLFDPRGRINRAGLLAVAIVLLVLELGAAGLCYLAEVPTTGFVFGALKLLFTWLATAAVIKRLHDLGLGAGMLLKASLGVILWSVILTIVLMALFGDAAMQEGKIGFWMSVGGTVAPVLVLILWLHVARGVEGPNVFGPEPAAFHICRHVPDHDKAGHGEVVV